MRQGAGGRVCTWACTATMWCTGPSKNSLEQVMARLAQQFMPHVHTSFATSVDDKPGHGRRKHRSPEPPERGAGHDGDLRDGARSFVSIELWIQKTYQLFKDTYTELCFGSSAAAWVSSGSPHVRPIIFGKLKTPPTHRLRTPKAANRATPSVPQLHAKLRSPLATRLGEFASARETPVLLLWRDFGWSSGCIHARATGGEPEATRRHGRWLRCP